MEPAVAREAGGGGEETNRTFKAGVLGRDYSLSPAVFWPLLCAYNERCVPQWSEQKLRQKMKSGYSSARAVKPGQASPAATFAAVPVPPVPVPQEPRSAPVASVGPAEGFRSAWQEEIVRTDKGAWKNCLRNVELVLMHDERINQCIRYNAFTERIEVTRAPWRRWTGTAEWSDSDGVAFVTWCTTHLPGSPVVHQGHR